MRRALLLLLCASACVDDVLEAENYRTRWCTRFGCSLAPDGGEGGGEGGGAGGAAGGAGVSTLRIGDFPDGGPLAGVCTALRLEAITADGGTARDRIPFVFAYGASDTRFFDGPNCLTAPTVEPGAALSLFSGTSLLFRAASNGATFITLSTDAGFAPASYFFSPRGQLHAVRLRPDAGCTPFAIIAGTLEESPLALPATQRGYDTVDFTCMTAYANDRCMGTPSSTHSFDGGNRFVVSFRSGAGCRLESGTLGTLDLDTGLGLGATQGAGSDCLNGTNCFSQGCIKPASKCQCVMPGGSCRDSMLDCCSTLCTLGRCE